MRLIQSASKYVVGHVFLACVIAFFGTKTVTADVLSSSASQTVANVNYSDTCYPHTSSDNPQAEDADDVEVEHSGKGDSK